MNESNVRIGGVKMNIREGNRDISDGNIEFSMGK